MKATTSCRYNVTFHIMTMWWTQKNTTTEIRHVSIFYQSIKHIIQFSNLEITTNKKQILLLLIYYTVGPNPAWLYHYFRVQYAMTKMTNRKTVRTRVVVKAVKGLCPSSKCSTRDCRMPACPAGMPAHTSSNRSSLSVSSSPSCCLASVGCSLVGCSSSSPSGAWREMDHETS